MRQSQLLHQGLLILLGFATVYTVMVLVVRSIGLDNLHQWVQRSGGWAPCLYILVCAFSLIIAPLSGSSLFIAGGALFGKDLAYFLSLLASVLGCSTNFWISRYFGRNVVLRLIGRKNLKGLDKFTVRLKGDRGLFYLILLMPLSQDIVSYAAGLTVISYSRFLVALIVSGLVVVGAYTYLGSSLLEALI